MKVTDELQFGVPEQYYTHKVFNVDFSEFDLSDKKQKKAAEKKGEKAVARFRSREKRLKGHIWSRPTIDLKAGTVTLAHSRVGDICTEAFFEAGRVYAFSSPVESEWDDGLNWWDCH